MAKLTKNEEYIVEQYVRYFGKAPSKAEIAKYNDFKTPKEILTEIIGDADDSKATLTTKEFVNNAFQNLFGRDATTKEMNKYSKVVDKGEDLPINAIVKAAKKSDKAVYEAKKAVALFIAEKDITTNYNLDKITKDTYKDVYDLKAKKLLVDSVAELKTKIDAMPDNVTVTSETFMLTASADNFVGTEKGDVFNAYEEFNAAGKFNTLTGVDSLDGGAGRDELNVKTDADIAAVTATVKSIETINLESGAGVTFDTTTYTGVETLNATKGTSATLKAAATTDVNVSGVTNGTVAVDGGKNVNVTVGATGTNTTIGATTGAKGTVTVTDAALGTAEIKVDGGTDVTITATGSTNTGGTTGDISVGTQATPILPTGAVTVSSTGVYADANVAMGAIKIDGGSTVTVTQSAGITDAQKTAALTDGSNNTVTQGAITIKGDGNTTTVNVKQDATVAAGNGAAAVAGSTQTQTVTFNALAAGNTVTVNGLTFTAAKDLTAAEVAAAFANLTSGDTQSNTGITTNGSYTNSNTAGFTTGAVVGNTVVYSETVNGAGALVVAPTTTQGTGVTAPTAPTIALTTTGATTTPAVDGKIGVAAAVVTVTDNAVAAADKIKTVTVDGFKTTSSVTSDALTDLTLKNGDVNAAFTVTNAVASSSLTLNVDNITGATTSKIDLAGTTITNLTINATGKDSAFILDADGLVDLTINATAGLNLSAATINYATANLDNVTIKGAGAVNLGDISAATGLVSFNASANTGGVTASINAATAGSHADLKTFVFSAGKDAVTISTQAINKAINLGAGDDTINFNTSTAALADVTGTIDGGAGTDTIHMTAALAVLATAAGSTFDTQISNIEQLSLGTLGAASIVDLAKMDNISYVISANNAATAYLLTLNNMANNGKLELGGMTATNSNTTTVSMKDASGAADTFNIITNVDGSDLDMGTVTVAGVETISITADDSSTDIADGDSINTATLELTAAAAKTINVKGDSDIDLTLTGSTKVTMIDGSTMTGDLTVTALNSGMTVKGGAGNDTLSVDNTTTASLMSNVVLTGGKGTDTFDVSAFNANGNPGSAVTITDLTAGETIVFKGTGVEKFVSGKVTLIAESTFTEYVSKAAEIANAASTGTEDNIAWFQFNNNTFVVQDVDSDGTFNTGDIIVKINGVKDLSTASFNATDGTLEIA